ncbi:MAG: hypothetical protein PSV35_07390 [bacterium]|nr:hypothetical protein [bacterium]
MAVTLKTIKFKYMSEKQYVAFVKNAINVPMDKIAFDECGKNKTFITDALATCIAVVMYGSKNNPSVAFSHLSSESTEVDDERKTKTLEQMLYFILTNNQLSDVKICIAPSNIKENHLISFILKWAETKKIEHHLMTIGGDSAVFHLDKNGHALMLTTSLKLNELDASHNEPSAFTRCNGQGVVKGIKDDYNQTNIKKNNNVFFSSVDNTHKNTNTYLIKTSLC